MIDCNHSNLRCEFNQPLIIQKAIDNLTKLTPNAKKVASMVSIVGLSVFATIKAVALAEVFFLIPCMVPGSILVGVAVYDYFMNRRQIKRAELDVASAYKNYPEYILINRKCEKVIALSEEDIQLISPYTSKTNPLPYQIREGTHYKLEGGLIGNWSVTPLTLIEVCKKTNVNKVIATYKPWVDLLIVLAKNPKVPVKFLHLIGNMAGFNRGFLYYENEKFMCTYRNKYIECCPTDNSKPKINIYTPENCREFVERYLIP